MTLPEQVKLVEVGPRDGLQNEKTPISLEVKLQLIRYLKDAGLNTIEATSFVSAKWVPQMADHEALLGQLPLDGSVKYPVLIPNEKGFLRAQACGVKDIAVFAAASESFSQKNINCSIAESLQRFAPVCEQARAAGIRIRGYISCVLGCPYEGDIQPESVLKVAEVLNRLGCDEISLGDTIGTGTPKTVQTLLNTLNKALSIDKIAVHFHDTYGLAIANIVAALEMGVSIIDSSVSGLGGCPYAKGATGNVATEDVLYLLNGLGIKTGVDMNKLLKASYYIANELGRPPQSKVALALGEPQ